MHITKYPPKFVTRTGREVSQANPWAVFTYGLLFLVTYGVALILVARLILGDN